MEYLYCPCLLSTLPDESSRITCWGLIEKYSRSTVTVTLIIDLNIDIRLDAGVLSWNPLIQEAFSICKALVVGQRLVWVLNQSSMNDIQNPNSTGTAPLAKYLFAHQQEKLKELEGKVYDQKLARGIHKLLEMAETLSAFIHVPN